MNLQDTLGIRLLAVSLVAGNDPFRALTSTPSICFLFLASRFGVTDDETSALAPPSGGGPLFFQHSLRLPLALEKAAKFKLMFNPTPILTFNARNAPDSPDSLFTHNAAISGI